MKRRKFLFWAALLLSPGLIWLSSISSSYQRYQGSRALLQDWETRAIEANQSLRERDLLLTRWANLEPTASDALVDLENELNPLLVQKRTVVAARKLGIKAQVQQKMAEEGGHPSWTIQAEADYASLVRLLDRLERGNLRARFQDINLMLPTERGENKVRLAAEFQVPALPTRLKEKGA